MAMISLTEHETVGDLDSGLGFAAVLQRKTLMLLELSELLISHK